MKKKTFLGNLKNKQKFINLLSSEIRKEGILVKKSVGDADYDIVMSALAHTRPVVVVADDTDILILLQPHFRPAEHESVYLHTRSKLISIKIIQRSIDPVLSKSLLFIHALSGCDTTIRHWEDLSNGEICGFKRRISDLHVAK